jgi:hypothetical protein
MERVPNNSWPIQSNTPQALQDYAQLIGIDPSIEWQMESSEQLALLAVLQNLRPECAIEVGSRWGGSMQILSRFAQRVISCDIDPTCRERLGSKYPNAEFVTGDSKDTLPVLMKQLQADGVKVGFLLVDGDHSTRGIEADIHGLLEYVPSCPMYVIMHDSFNPDVRAGIRRARWADNMYVHSVEIDFIPGVLHQGGDAHREMWGGFGLAVLRPEKRTGTLQISARKEALFKAVLRHSVHWFFDPPTLTKRAARKLGKLVGIK